MSIPATVGVLSPPVFIHHEENIKEASDGMEKDAEVLATTSDVGRVFHKGDGTSSVIEYDDATGGNRQEINISKGIHLHGDIAQKFPTSSKIPYCGLNFAGGVTSPDAQMVSSSSIKRTMRIFLSESEEDTTEALAAHGSKVVPPSYADPTTNGSLSASRSNSRGDLSLNDLQLHTKSPFSPLSPHHSSGTSAIPSQEFGLQNSDTHAGKHNTKTGELANNGAFKENEETQALRPPHCLTPLGVFPQSDERGLCFVPKSPSGGQREGRLCSNVEKVLSVTCSSNHGFQGHEKDGNEGLGGVSKAAVHFSPTPARAQEALKEEEKHSTKSYILTTPNFGTSAADFLSIDTKISEESNLSDSHITLDIVASATWGEGKASGAAQTHSFASDGKAVQISPSNTKAKQGSIHNSSPWGSRYEFKVARAQQPPIPMNKRIDKQFEASESSNTTLSEDSDKVILDYPLSGFTAHPFTQSVEADVHCSSNLSMPPSLRPSPLPSITLRKPHSASVERISESLQVDPMEGFSPSRLTTEQGRDAELHSEPKSSSLHAGKNFRSLLPPSNVEEEVMTNDSTAPKGGAELFGYSNGQLNNPSHLDTPEAMTKFKCVVSTGNSFETKDMSTHSATFSTSHPNSFSRNKDAKLGEADVFCRRDTTLEEEISIEVENSLAWSENLTTMTLVDVTPLSLVYHGYLVRGDSDDRNTVSSSSSTVETKTMLMVLRVYELMSADRQGFTHSFLQQRALKLARKILKTQRRLQEAGLVDPSESLRLLNMRSDGYDEQRNHDSGSDRDFDSPVICRGIIDLHVDSSNRIIAELDIEPYSISVNDVIAFQSTMLSREELATLLRSVLTCLSPLHKAGITHGALHGGNIMLSTNDGHCTLTQPAGLMNTKIYPDDLSILPPSKAAMLAPQLRRVPSEHETAVSQSRTSAKTFRPGLADELELCMLELEENAPWYFSQHTDDLYAIGALALFVVTGIPIFYGRTYREVVETLAELRRLVTSGEICSCVSHANNGGSDKRGSVQQALYARIFSSCFTQSAYVALRCQKADYTEDFLNDLFEFIFDSMVASFGVLDEEVHYHNAEDLLNHSFFEKYFMKGESRESRVLEEDGAMQAMNDILHRVTYPIYTTITLNKSLCGTKPYITRMHQHSIFSSRWTALRKSVQHFCGDHFWRDGDGAQGSNNGCFSTNTVDGMGALWPTLGRRPAGQWTVTVPWSWSLPLLPDRGASDIVIPAHYDSHSSQMLQSSFISPQNTGKVDFFYESVGGEFYLSSSFDCLRIPSSPFDDLWVQNSISCRQIPQSHATDPIFQKEKEKLEQQTGCKVLIRFRTILFSSKQNSLLTLHRGQMDHFRDNIDTLVLKDLECCQIVLLVPFRFVVLVNVKQCEVYLAPCFICYMHQVTHCTPVAVACMYLVLYHVERVALHCMASALILEDKTNGGGDAAHGFDPNTTLKDVHCEPYSLLYSGLSEDFLHVGLPQESSAYACCIGKGITPVSETQIPEHTLSLPGKATRSFNFMNVGPPTDDIPYSHALTAYGKRFNHCDDNESDVYFFFNELHGKDIHMVNVHGGPKPETSSPRGGLYTDSQTDKARTASISGVDEIIFGMALQHTRVSSNPSQLLGYCGMQQHGRKDVHKAGVAKPKSLFCTTRCPVFFVLDVVEDVVIRNCSHCTVFLVGSMGSMIIENCHDMRIFTIARECAIDACTNLEFFALITEYLVLERCHDVIVSPFFLECPYLDTILKSIIQKTSEESQEYVFEAYEQRDMYSLNKVFRISGQDVYLSACERVEVQDLAWYQEHPDERPILLSVSVPVSEAQKADTEAIRVRGETHAFEALDRGNNEEEFLSEVGIASSNFFKECCEAVEGDIDSIFLRFSFRSMLYKYELQHTTVDKEECETSNFEQVIRMHDLFNPSLLRLPGSLRMRSDYSVQPGGETAWQEDLPYDREVQFEVDNSSLSHKFPLSTGSTSDLILESIVMGKVHLIEAVGNLYICNCMGPLDILVCAAKYVVMEGCVNVTLRAACVAFDAQDSHHCHVALHVNTSPGYLRCSHMLTSAFNVVAPSLEELMRSAGVKTDVNLFNRLFFHSATMRHVTDDFAKTDERRRLELLHGSAVLKDDYWNRPEFEVLRRSFRIEEGSRVESLAQSFLYLRRPIAIVPPLPELLIELGGVNPHSFMPLDVHATKEEGKTQTLKDTLRRALGFIAGSDLVALHALEEADHIDDKRMDMTQQRDILEKKEHTSSKRIIASNTSAASADIKGERVQEPEEAFPTSFASVSCPKAKAIRLSQNEDVQKPSQVHLLLNEALLRSHTTSQESPCRGVDVASVPTPVIVYPPHALAPGADDPILQNKMPESTPTGRTTTGADTTTPVCEGESNSFDMHINALDDDNSKALGLGWKDYPFQPTIVTAQSIESEVFHEELSKSSAEPVKHEVDDTLRSESSKGDVLEGRYSSPQGYDNLGGDFHGLQSALENARRKYQEWREGDSDGAILAARVVSAIQKITEL